PGLLSLGGLGRAAPAWSFLSAGGLRDVDRPDCGPGLLSLGGLGRATPTWFLGRSLGGLRDVDRRTGAPAFSLAFALVASNADRAGPIRGLMRLGLFVSRDRPRWPFGRPILVKS